MRAMSGGLGTTFRTLAETGNEASVRVLIPALDSPRPTMQDRALKALLKRRSPAGHREILRRLHTIPERWKAIIQGRRARLGRTLRDAVLSSDWQLCRNGCTAAVWFGEYDLIPTLLNLLEDRTAENAELAAETLTDLVGRLYSALAGPHDADDRRDPQLVRNHVLTSLEHSVKRYAQHNRREVIEAFLLLVRRDNATMTNILRDPHDPSFLTIIEILSKSSRGGVMRLLLSYLDDPHVPPAVISVVAKRTDLDFVGNLLRKIGREPSSSVKQNLKRIKSIGWLQPDQEFLDQLDDTSQHAMVRLVMSSGIPRAQAFETIKLIVQHGNQGGRRAAAQALSEFSGTEANALALRVLDDADPQVQANVTVQLRQRGIPGILPRLLEMIDVPHEVVREAVREALAEFTFPRFLGAFDLLDDEVRHSTGMLVKKIDPDTVPLLKGELNSQVRTRRLRGLEIARVLGVVDQLDETIGALLEDGDHLVRAEAAASLAMSTSAASLQTLIDALDDRSEAVREASQRSLVRRLQSQPRRHGFIDPPGVIQ
ncbi:MAG TPA: HEAT repeat domain-containing protein [Thermoguttaceae bacterium]|nr:HEAT repeat domain-containing protein [Thermoguttaceae bacterium]